MKKQISVKTQTKKTVAKIAKVKKEKVSETKVLEVNASLLRKQTKELHKEFIEWLKAKSVKTTKTAIFVGIHSKNQKHYAGVLYSRAKYDLLKVRENELPVDFDKNQLLCIAGNGYTPELALKINNKESLQVAKSLIRKIHNLPQSN